MSTFAEYQAEYQKRKDWFFLDDDTYKMVMELKNRPKVHNDFKDIVSLKDVKAGDTLRLNLNPYCETSQTFEDDTCTMNVVDATCVLTPRGVKMFLVGNRVYPTEDFHFEYKGYYNKMDNEGANIEKRLYVYA